MDPQIPLHVGRRTKSRRLHEREDRQRRYYDRVLPALKDNMVEFSRLTGRRYDLVMPYRLEDAEYAIVGSGCMIETAEAAVDYMRDRLGIKVGILHVTCFRPFPSADIVRALRHVRRSR
jgi:pyruvate-ferredoxin/flavodoxin oxidoreductase